MDLSSGLSVFIRRSGTMGTPQCSVRARFAPAIRKNSAPPIGSVLAAQAVVEPGPGERPVPISRAAGESERFGGLTLAEPHEEAELHEAGADGVIPFESL